MTGSLQVKNGYIYVVIAYKDEIGNKKYKWVSTGLKERGNRKAAKEILERELKVFEEQQTATINKIEQRKKPKEADKTEATMLFSDYCAKYVESVKSKLSPQVYYNYSVHYIKLFKEFFDKKKLRVIDITEQELEDFYTHSKKRGVKNISIKHYNSVLRPALRKAYKDKLIPDNPFEFLEPIKKEKISVSFYDKNEMKTLFEAIRGHTLKIPFILAAYYGFRRSEVLGLRWSAIDFDHKLISINHKFLVVKKVPIFSDELKTKTSYRTLPLIPVVKEALLKHKAQIEKNKKFYGDTYDLRYRDYVCIDERGKIIYPDHMTKKFGELLKEKKLKYIRLHDLRHSCASNMLASGIQMKEIQEWLGHSNFSTTADVYSHLDFSSKIKAAKTIASVYENKTKQKDPPQNNEQNSTAMLIEALKEMSLLGFDNIQDFLMYKQKQDITPYKAEKDDMEM